MELKDVLPWIGIIVTMLGAMLHANARFVRLETKVDLMLEALKHGIFEPFTIRGKHGD